MEKIFALDTELNKTQFESISKAVEFNPYLIYVFNRSTWQNLGYTNAEYEWNFYDSKGKYLSEIREGRWAISGIESRANGFFQKTIFGFYIIDPLGKTKSVSKNSPEAGIRFLRTVAKFESLEHYELSEEIEKLRIENHKLKEAVKSLAEKIGILSP